MAGWLSDEELAGFRSDWDAELKTSYTLKNPAPPYATLETGRCNVIAPGSASSPHMTTMYRQMLATTKAERLVELPSSSLVEKTQRIVIGSTIYKVVDVEKDDTFMFGPVAAVQKVPS